MNRPVQTVPLSGFDPQGEPEIRVMPDGSLYVVFNFMPPSYAEEEGQDLGRFADFDRQMERAIGVSVIWEDREVFHIERPQGDTVEVIRRFVEGYGKSQRGGSASAR